MVFTAYNKQYERTELVKAIPNITDRAIAESVVQRTAVGDGIDSVLLAPDPGNQTRFWLVFFLSL